VTKKKVPVVGANPLDALIGQPVVVVLSSGVPMGHKLTYLGFDPGGFYVFSDGTTKVTRGITRDYIREIQSVPPAPGAGEDEAPTVSDEEGLDNAR
jgi:hypothetical protein